MLETFFCWPDQLSKTSLDDPIDEAARLLRLQHFVSAESLMLARLAIKSEEFELLVLLALLRLRFAQIKEAQALIELLRKIRPGSPEISFLQAQYWLQTAQIELLRDQSQNIWKEPDQFWPLKLCQVAFLIHINQLERAQSILLSIPNQDSLEVIRLHCRLLSRRFLYREALDLLMPAIERFPNHLPATVHLLSLTYLARDQQRTLPCLRRAIDEHGMQPEFCDHICKVQMLLHKLSDARRTSLKQQSWNTVITSSNIASTNLFNNYERLGYVDWLSYLKDGEVNISIEMRENLIMQLASIESPKTKNYLVNLLPELRSQLASVKLDKPWNAPRKELNKDKKLTVAWLSPDIGYHPVSRFLLGFFSSTDKLVHRHILVDTNDQIESSNRHLFEELPQLEVCNLGTSWWPDAIPRVRALEADVAIDLSGWTGGHFARGFLARVAQLQVNYLGYFASTGLPSMDIWLGDEQLFPQTHNEWHTEELHRLNRCFIAWQPPSSLPEAQIDVVEAPSGGIRFGSFNHNRKLSDITLRLWARLFEILPTASLVLKAPNTDDHGTQELLCRRMRHQGFDPDRVIWLPRAPSAIEHLEQYKMVDVVLDCFPNGGCTTTCEALWMGSPVIALAGNSYVSRMSTAVLHGAGLSDWSVDSSKAYLDKAVEQADCLLELRQNRHKWRNLVRTNPLGNAEDLMLNIEQDLIKLYEKTLLK